MSRRRFALIGQTTSGLRGRIRCTERGESRCEERGLSGTLRDAGTGRLNTLAPVYYVIISM
jgi:hypothetical protein